MKKFVKKAILPALIAMTITGTTYAASFTDVPANHWAYASVNQLVKAGLVEGYGDGTFRGDRTITRYEMAIIVGKAIDRFDKADDNQKKEIDKLSAEFAGELNRMGVRVAKVEAKTNSWVAGGETRIRFVTDSPSYALDKKLHGSDQFQFRQRIFFKGTINDKMSWFTRLTASGNAGNYNNAYSPADGTVAGFDAFTITAKDTLGFDSIRLGRYPLDSYTTGLFGKAVGVDGVRIDKKFGKVSFVGAVNNVKSLALPSAAYNQNDQGTATPLTEAGGSGNARTLSTGQLSWKAADNLTLRAGYYNADIPGTARDNGMGSINALVTGDFKKSHGYSAGFATKFGGLQLLGDYVSSKLDGVTGALPNNSPKAWAVELTDSKCPPVFYYAVNLVNPAKDKVGTGSWMASYRSVDPGAIPDGAGGFDTMAVAYSGKALSIMKGTDNVNVLFLAYQNVVAKNVLASLEFQDFKIKNTALTGGVKNLDKTYKAQLEFFY